MSLVALILQPSIVNLLVRRSLGLAASRPRRPAQLNDGLAGAPRRGDNRRVSTLRRRFCRELGSSTDLLGRDGHGGQSGAGRCSEHRRVGVLGTHELSAEVIQPAKQPNFGHLADVLREAQSEPSRHWSPMPSASGDGSLGEIVDAVREHTLPPVWRRLVFSLGVIASLVVATGAEASAGAAVTPPGRWWSRAENPRSRWLRGRQAHRTEPKRGTT